MNEWKVLHKNPIVPELLNSRFFSYVFYSEHPWCSGSHFRPVVCEDPQQL